MWQLHQQHRFQLDALLTNTGASLTWLLPWPKALLDTLVVRLWSTRSPLVEPEAMALSLALKDTQVTSSLWSWEMQRKFRQVQQSTDLSCRSLKDVFLSGLRPWVSGAASWFSGPRCERSCPTRRWPGTGRRSSNTRGFAFSKQKTAGDSHLLTSWHLEGYTPNFHITIVLALCTFTMQTQWQRSALRTLTPSASSTTGTGLDLRLDTTSLSPLLLAVTRYWSAGTAKDRFPLWQLAKTERELCTDGLAKCQSWAQTLRKSERATTTRAQDTVGAPAGLCDRMADAVWVELLQRRHGASIPDLHRVSRRHQAGHILHGDNTWGGKQQASRLTDVAPFPYPIDTQYFCVIICRVRRFRNGNGVMKYTLGELCTSQKKDVTYWHAGENYLAFCPQRLCSVQPSVLLQL